LLVLAIGVANCAIANYCGRDDLCPTKPFVACGASGGPGPKCEKGAYNPDLSGKYQQQILDLHNKLRNDLAGGNVSGYNPASKMATMVSSPR
jgi:hypothetical protein